MNARLSTPMNSRIPSQNLAHQAKTKRMVQLALMISIIFVMAFSPLGYLRTPGLTITFLTVPVAVGAVLMGPLAGAVCGLAFGITSLITAMTGGSPFSSMLLSINPLALAFTCMVPRVLEGWLCGLIFAALRPRFKKCFLFYCLSGLPAFKHCTFYELL